LNFNNDDANNDSMFEDRRNDHQVGGDLKPPVASIAQGLHAQTESDDIVELEFNGYSNSAGNTYDTEPIPVQSSRKDSIASEMNVHRARTNSLALPGLLLDGANPEDVGQLSFSQWMDKELSQTRAQIAQSEAEEAEKRKSDLLSSECNNLMASKNSTDKPKSRKKFPKKPALPTKNKKEKKEKVKKDKQREKRQYKKKEEPNLKPLMFGGEKKPVPSGLGQPRSMSDPNLSVRLDEFGLLHVDGPDGWVGAYSPTSRDIRVNRWKEKRNSRIWEKRSSMMSVRTFANSRLRVKGRFVKKEDETLMRELMSLT